ncbi:MAG: aminopeptidase P family protein [Blautia sp.]|nr:aminopeptidase P family protein [Blautia sp.]
MSMHDQRIRQVMEKSSAAGVEQLLLSDPLAIYYLTGVMLHPGERFLGLLLSEGKRPVLFVNELLRFQKELPFLVVWYRDGENILDQVVREIRVKNGTEEKSTLGVDKNFPARFLLPVLFACQNVMFTDGSRYVDDCRAVKDAFEQECMIRSSEINDQTMEQAFSLLHTGITELDLAEAVEKIYRSLGADGLAFSPKPAFGENTGSPHHRPGDRTLKEGDIVRLDIGCTYEHYCSDMTRTCFYRRHVTEEEQRIYQLVREANEAAERAVHPGTALKEIDRTARQIIERGGYGKQFSHRLGHFIGLEDHDAGDVSAQSEETAGAGQIFSIEPGIYLPGKLGIRIEDLVLVTEDGARILNHFPKELQVLG